MKTVILKNLYQGENSVKMMIRNGEKIYQQLTKFVFDVDKDSIVFQETGGTDTLTITANEPWAMTVPGWVSASALSGKTSATITLTSQPTEETLEGDIVITCNGVQKTVSVTAVVHDYSKDYLTIEAIGDGFVRANGGGLYFSINNGEWYTTNNPVNLMSGDTVRIKSTRFCSQHAGVFLETSLPCNIYGNIMSLGYGDEFEGKTEIPSYAYNSCFRNWSGIVSAKNLVLPATTLVTNCYQYMFQNCGNLSYIKCLATYISAQDCTHNWLSGVSPTGTFVKAAGVTWPTGNSGIPSGWTVIEE